MSYLFQILEGKQIHNFLEGASNFMGLKIMQIPYIFMMKIKIEWIIFILDKRIIKVNYPEHMKNQHLTYHII